MSPMGFDYASAEYQKLRAELREAEIALRDQRERVAALRRQLPGDTQVATDYVLHAADLDSDAAPREVRLSQLFAKPELPLVLLHFMFGKAQTEPCPMCTLWADGYDGIVSHLCQRANFGVVAAAEVAAFRAYGRGRGWRNLPLLSAGDSTFKVDLGSEGPDGTQQPAVSVFTRDPDGVVRHTYTGSAMMGGGEFRGMDLLCPLWHFLDLLPEGRGDFMPRTRYEG